MMGVIMIDGRKFGLLAYQVSGQLLPVQVLRSAAGYYLGTALPSGEPVSRESECYFYSAREAQRALSRGVWDQRPRP